MLRYTCYLTKTKLGPQYLPMKRFIQWQVRTTFYRKKNSVCKVRWKNGYLTFFAFENKRVFLKGCGGPRCAWNATVQGLYLYNIRAQKSILKYGWRIHRRL
ncbi:hypothetical protein RND81_12G231200 [Saponaria officinalis]|uniref:Uncharacterized protein n=1 Tax=Saponaria officinalis TaxID=3572 RepID=A0AAW1HED5_SAPOF